MIGDNKCLDDLMTIGPFSQEVPKLIIHSTKEVARESNRLFLSWKWIGEARTVIYKDDNDMVVWLSFRQKRNW